MRHPVHQPPLWPGVSSSFPRPRLFSGSHASTVVVCRLVHGLLLVAARWCATAPSARQGGLSMDNFLARLCNLTVLLPHWCVCTGPLPFLSAPTDVIALPPAHRDFTRHPPSTSQQMSPNVRPWLNVGFQSSCAARSHRLWLHFVSSLFHTPSLNAICLYGITSSAPFRAHAALELHVVHLRFRF